MWKLIDITGFYYNTAENYVKDVIIYKEKYSTIDIYRYIIAMVEGRGHQQIIVASDNDVEKIENLFDLLKHGGSKIIFDENELSYCLYGCEVNHIMECNVLNCDYMLSHYGDEHPYEHNTTYNDYSNSAEVKTFSEIFSQFGEIQCFK
jgi:hypothetical protein